MSAFGPNASRVRWFFARALHGPGPKLALVDAVIVLVVALVVASVWRRTGGPRAELEAIVPLIGTALRYSVGLPLAYGALRAMQDDNKAGYVALARRRGISAGQYLRYRAVGAGLLVAVVVAGPMVIVSLVLSGFGGGVEGALARASLVFPSLFVGAGTGLLFGFGAVALGAWVSSRPVAFVALLGTAALGALLEGVVRGAAGHALRQLASPLRALDDAQSAAFAAPNSLARGLSAIVSVAVVLLVTERIAERTVDAQSESAP